MKRINLLPEEELKRRGLLKYRKYLLLIIVIMVFVAIGFNYNLDRLDKKKDTLESKVREVSLMESKVSQKKEELLELNDIKFELKQNNIPINNITYFIGKDLPPNMQLFEVLSSNILESEKLETPVEENELDMTSDESNTEVSEDTEAVEEDVEEDVEVNSEDVVSEKETDAKKGENISLNTNGEYLIFRGSALIFDDIASFMVTLDEQEYLEGAELIDIQYYFNGFQKYNIFEIHAKITY